MDYFSTCTMQNKGTETSLGISSIVGRRIQPNTCHYFYRTLLIALCYLCIEQKRAPWASVNTSRHCLSTCESRSRYKSIVQM